ncbi:SIS domain-containing protein [Anaerocolumna chitinilytica]|uniref:Phosphosugar isomerase n=1 Tax=Anaerocolumna chitinilytica TaxID=1727145 RepID=A0A7I8DMI2_9FIRM|nr:SIS domain-containing protein [Anaerocolumna chitinilytica]BCJ98927.1 phosphosugar isomerase [Anaerocolumna chitinilytica]
MGYKSTDIKSIVAEILEAKRDKGGIKSLYFVGCGGSLGALYPAKTFMEKESASIKSAWINSNEFVHCTPNDFGENSILVMACHKGNTPETIQAAKLGKEKGAAVIILTWLEESEIVEFGDYIVLYSFDASQDHLAGDIDYAGEKTLCALYVAVELLAQTQEGYKNYDKFYEGAGMITNIIRNARTHVKERAKIFAKARKNDSVIYTMGSGASYGAAYMESICIFMEMQWLDSSSIHTGEFFHGPFEITDANRPFVIQISEGSTRSLDERALIFLQKYAKNIEILDAKELGLSVIDVSVVDYFNHSLFNNVYPIYNHELATIRQHPLATRRYMWKVEY